MINERKEFENYISKMKQEHCEFSLKSKEYSLNRILLVVSKRFLFPNEKYNEETYCYYYDNNFYKLNDEEKKEKIIFTKKVLNLLFNGINQLDENETIKLIRYLSDPYIKSDDDIKNYFEFERKEKLEQFIFDEAIKRAIISGPLSSGKYFIYSNEQMAIIKEYSMKADRQDEKGKQYFNIFPLSIMLLSYYFNKSEYAEIDYIRFSRKEFGNWIDKSVIKNYFTKSIDANKKEIKGFVESGLLLVNNEQMNDGEGTYAKPNEITKMIKPIMIDYYDTSEMAFNDDGSFVFYDEGTETFKKLQSILKKYYK